MEEMVSEIIDCYENDLMGKNFDCDFVYSVRNFMDDNEGHYTSKQEEAIQSIYDSYRVGEK